MGFLTSQQKETFDHDGYLVVKALLQPIDLAPLIDVAAQVVDQQTQALFAEGKITERHEDQRFDKRWYEVYLQCASEQPQYAWHTVVFSQALFNLITHPRVLDLIEAFLGPEIQFNGDFWVRPKLPSERITTLPWHQDSAYMPKTENDLHLAIWIPLVDVNKRNGTLQYIPGSHRQGLQAMHKVEGEQFKVPVHDPGLAAEQIDTLEMKVGDIVIFNNLVFHRSLVNQSEGIRWSTDFRYSAADTSLYDLWHKALAFTVRSERNPDQVGTWEQWQAKWNASEHKNSRM